VTVAVVATATLAGCSVTVQPKNAAATRPLDSATATPSASAPATAPSGDAGSASPDQSASSSSSEGADVDHAACTAVRQALLTVQQKVEADKNSRSRMADDYKAAATTLRTQATKTKDSDLKTALQALANGYQALGADTSKHNSTTADLKKVTEDAKPLDTLCGAKS